MIGNSEPCSCNHTASHPDRLWQCWRILWRSASLETNMFSEMTNNLLCGERSNWDNAGLNCERGRIWHFGKSELLFRINEQRHPTGRNLQTFPKRLWTWLNKSAFGINERRFGMYELEGWAGLTVQRSSHGVLQNGQIRIFRICVRNKLTVECQ